MNMTPASPSHDKELVPRKLLFLTLGLMLASLVLVTTARLTDAPMSALPDMNAPIAAERLIILHGEMNGRATVLDQHGAVITRLAPDAGGFIAGMERVLARVRTQQGLPHELPVRLIRFESGRLALTDPHTDWRAELIGFGRDNTAAFAKLLH
jgi:putative photosynthetic complex assembly protein